jgi:very-short-patch-repair endonuclease
MKVFSKRGIKTKMYGKQWRNNRLYKHSANFRNFIENLPYNIELKARSRALRKAGVLSEVIFWLQVHKGIFWKIDFDRQRIIGNYIVDFYVKTLGLVIEIDGSSHDNKEEYDQIREDYLVSLGLKVYRISDLRVKHDLSNVMTELERYIVAEFGNKMTPI